VVGWSVGRLVGRDNVTIRGGVKIALQSAVTRGRSVGRLVGRSVGRLVGRSAGRSVGWWLVGWWLVGWSAGRLVAGRLGAGGSALATLLRAGAGIPVAGCVRQAASWRVDAGWLGR
jgi:hypothetical protein